MATTTGVTPNSWRRNCSSKGLRDLRRQPACATLGYFDDPVLNTFLRLGPLEVTRTVFHEWARQLVFVAGETRLNESFATAVENEGLRRWLAR
ncbi:aminopeptidase [Accumulibacter sp.]|uniref:aminopeptidase n=1 Tax=Accumulibacter sp. TaxID=2053492 RepID=UPI0035ADAF86